MAPAIPQFNWLPLRSYLFRLPLLTRVAIGLILAIWLVGVQSVWDMRQWGSLIPSEVGLTSMYRINTYPLIHVNLLHTLLNVIALTPLLERFEAEHGTLHTLALFAGPLSTFPAGLYILIERLIWRGDTPIMGASMWVFVLLGMEALKTHRSNPSINVGGYRIPTWTLPIMIILVVSFLVPNTSLLGHLCALTIGFLYGLGYLKILAPPEKALRWIEGKLNLLGRLPHYVSVDQKTYGRYGVLPTTTAPGTAEGVPLPYMASSQRLGA